MAKAKSEKATATEPKQSTALAVPAVVAPVPWTQEEKDFMQGLTLLGDQFAGFWQPEPGERLLGIYRGSQDVKGNACHKIQIAFPTWVYNTTTEGVDRIQAQAGTVVLCWEHYQLQDLKRVVLGSKLVIQRGAERDIGNGKRVVEYVINAEKVRPEEDDEEAQETTGAASTADQTPF